MPGLGFSDYLDGLLQIGRYASSDASVTLSVLTALARIENVASGVGAVDRCQAIRELAVEICEMGTASAQSDRDRSRLALD